MISVRLSDCLSVCDKNFNIAIFLVTISMIDVKLCLMVVLIELNTFVPLSVTVIVFQGHSSVKQFWLKILCSYLKLCMIVDYVKGIMGHLSVCASCSVVVILCTSRTTVLLSFQFALLKLESSCLHWQNIGITVFHMNSLFSCVGNVLKCHWVLGNLIWEWRNVSIFCSPLELLEKAKYSCSLILLQCLTNSPLIQSQRHMGIHKGDQRSDLPPLSLLLLQNTWWVHSSPSLITLMYSNVPSWNCEGFVVCFYFHTYKICFC